MARKLNEDAVRGLPAPTAGNKITYFAGAVLQGTQAPRGFGVRVTAAGAKSFVLNYRLKSREYRYTIGQWPDWSALRAMKEAKALRQRIDRGENPLDLRAPLPESKTVSTVIDDFVRRYVQNKERPLRTAHEYESAFNRLVKPSIGKLGIYELRRSHVAEMLDTIEDRNGPVMADRTRAYLRKALGWYAERDDQFNLNAAIVRVAPRANAKDRARRRVLSDDEIRIVWPILGVSGTFGALTKMLLLTAQRRDEVAQMSAKEIAKDGIWTIPAERYKTKQPNHVALSKAALALIETQTQVNAKRFGREGRGRTQKEQCPYLFPSAACTPFSGFGKSKAALDVAILKAMQKRAKRRAKIEPLPHWTLHDLRRTAKTLMVRAGVRPDISERVLGHIIAGVEGTYDRHSYADEKRDALEKLAEMIERILSPAPSNIANIDFARAKASRRHGNG